MNLTKSKFLFAFLVTALSGGLFFSNTAVADDGDAERGEQVFQQCAGCHQTGPNARNAFGPVLNDIVGRKAGSYSSYSYGTSLDQARKKGLIWTEEELFKWLDNPAGFLQAYLDSPNATSKMPISLKDEQMRRDVIAFLATQTSAASSSEQDASAQNEQAVTPKEVIKKVSADRWADYRNWTKINTKPVTGDHTQFLGGMHKGTKGYRDIFVNDIGLEAINGEAPYRYPVGTIIVKEQFKNRARWESQKKRGMTIMVKVADSENPELSNWLWSSGYKKKAKKSNFCSGCHSIAQKDDFVFSNASTLKEFKE